MTFLRALPPLRRIWPLAALIAITLFFALSPAIAQSPPAAPSGLTAAAGDRKVTLSWDNPGDSSITHYEYNVNHNDTGTGNLSGWSQWTAIPQSDSNTTEHAFNNLANGREYRYHLRAVNANGPSVGAPDAPPWFVKAIPSGPPAAPTGLTATAGNRSVTLNWNNPGDSSIIRYEYNVNHNDTGTGNLTGWSPWTAIHQSDSNTTQHTFDNLTNGREYRYHLRAVNSIGPSVGAPNAPPWFALASPAGSPSAPPTNLRVERVCDHLMKARWHHAAGATGYDLDISGNHRHRWQRLLTNWPGNSWKATWWQTHKTYYFRARSVNEAGTSGWVNSAAAPAPPCAVDNLRVVTQTTHGQDGGDFGGSGGDITASWNAGKRASAYHLDYAGTRIVSDLSSTSHTWTVGSRGTNDQVSAQSVNGAMTSGWSVANVAWLTASDVAARGATLNLAGHSGNWRYKASAGPDTSCSSEQTGTTVNLSGLDSQETYTYTAYDDDACANPIGGATFSTLTAVSVSVSNLDKPIYQYACSVNATVWCAVGFTTGTSTAGYTLTSFTARFGNKADPTGILGDIVVSLHADNSGVPASATLATLSGDNPDTAGEYTYTCSGSGCVLLPNTTYFAQFKATAGTNATVDYYELRTTQSDDETQTPGGNGWSLANETDAYSVDTNSWVLEYSDTVLLKVSANPLPIPETVSVSNLDKPIYQYACSLNATVWCAVGFTTGTSTAGYTLTSFTARFGNKADPTGILGDIVVSLHADNSGVPASATLATLSGDNPDTAGEYTYTCSGSGCSLSTSTTYFAQFKATAGTNATVDYYELRSTESDDETQTPGGNGWSLANETDAYSVDTDSWVLEYSDTSLIKVSATVNPP